LKSILFIALLAAVPAQGVEKILDFHSSIRIARARAEAGSGGWLWRRR